MYLITHYRTLYDTNPQATRTYSWSDLTAALSSFIETPDKFSVAGFGGHTLHPNMKRGVEAVSQVTLFVFDVDAGTPEDLDHCEMLLRGDNVAAHFYSSHSHTPAKPAFRLVIPPNRLVTPAEYPGLRAALIDRYKIPCKPNQSGDVSRFWFLPSHKPGAVPITETLDGQPLDVDALPPLPTPRRGAGRLDVETAPAVPFAPPPSPPPGLPIDTGPARKAIRARATKLARAGDPESSTKAEWLRRLLAGEALADHGSRNDTMARVCGMLVYTLPKDTPVEVHLLLIRPSLGAMILDGSKLTEEKVERMLLTAMRKRFQRDDELENWRKRIIEQKAELYASIGVRFFRPKSQE
jgi:hypothetical protein